MMRFMPCFARNSRDIGNSDLKKIPPDKSKSPPEIAGNGTDLWIYGGKIDSSPQSRMDVEELFITLNRV